MSKTRDFIDRIAPFAQRVSEEYGIPASVIIAQAALETGWGESVEGNNYFGIKATGNWQGATQTFMTREVLNGSNVSMRDAFRAYGSLGESVENYAELITGATRYRGALAVADDAHAFAAELQRAGYATDPNYASTLSRIIRQHDLTRFDTEVEQSRRASGSRTYDDDTLREYGRDLEAQREENPEPWEEFVNNPLVQSILNFIGSLFGIEQTAETETSVSEDQEPQAPAFNTASRETSRHVA